MINELIYVERKCEVCESILKVRQKKVCSRKCLGQLTGRRILGTKRPEVGKKIRDSLLGVKHSPERVSKVKKTKLLKRRELTEKDKMILVDYINSTPHTHKLWIIWEELGLSFYSSKRLTGFFRENKELKKRLKETTTKSPSQIKNWSVEKWKNFLNDTRLMTWNQLCISYEISSKVLKKLWKNYKLKILGEPNPINKKMTRIERMVFDILLEAKVDFRRERYLCKNYRVDFLVNDKTVIEVNGDYVHSNPRIYTSSVELNNFQKSNLVNDIRKKQWILENNYRYYIIWEMDLMNNYEKCKNELFEFIKSEKIQGESNGN